jgi:ABC-2 type transport system permease protein
MSWRTFLALLKRDVRVARRNLITTLLQNLLQPLLFTFVFGKVMTRSGLIAESYKTMLVPGIMALSMLMAGVWAVAMPLISEFQFTREIEDRLLAPVRIEWLAIEKVVAGVIQALVAGWIVIPAAWLLLGPGVQLSFGSPLELVAVTLLVALLASSIGLALGCSIGQTQVGLMFSLVLTPMIMLGCTYYPWSALAGFPVLKWVVLVNPLVYAGEGLRSVFAPQFPHMARWIVLPALGAFDAAFVALGLWRFRAKAVS